MITIQVSIMIRINTGESVTGGIMPGASSEWNGGPLTLRTLSPEASAALPSKMDSSCDFVVYASCYRQYYVIQNLTPTLVLSRPSHHTTAMTYREVGAVQRRLCIHVHQSSWEISYEKVSHSWDIKSRYRTRPPAFKLSLSDSSHLLSEYRTR
jgi:hypothetical protein